MLFPTRHSIFNPSSLIFRFFLLFSFFLVTGLNTLALGAKKNCPEKILARVEAQYQSISSFKARFSQVDRQTDGALRTATGKLSYQKPGKMRWDYEPPNEQLLVTNGLKVWLFDPLLENVTVQELGKTTHGTALAFLLGGGSLSRDFVCRPHSIPPPKDDLIYLELHPTTPTPSLNFMQVGVTPKKLEIRVLRMVDFQGNIRKLLLTQVKQGVVFPVGHFEFKITPGMEVIGNN